MVAGPTPPESVETFGASPANNGALRKTHSDGSAVGPIRSFPTQAMLMG